MNILAKLTKGKSITNDSCVFCGADCATAGRHIVDKPKEYNRAQCCNRCLVINSNHIVCYCGHRDENEVYYEKK